MSIAFDASAAGSGSSTISGSQGISWSHTCTGSNRGLCVFVTSGAELTITSVRYNNVTMTQSVTKTQGSFTSYMYTLINPATGSNTINVDASGGTGSSILSGTSASYTGVDHIEANTGTGGAASGTSVSGTVTTIVDNSWVVSGADVNNGTSLTGSTNTTKRNGNSVSHTVGIGDSNAAQTPAGSKTQAWTWTTSVSNELVIVSLAPPIVVNVNDTTTTSDSISTSVSTSFHTSVSDTSNTSDAIVAVVRAVITVIDTTTTSDTGTKIKNGFPTTTKSTSIWTTVTKS